MSRVTTDNGAGEALFDAAFLESVAHLRFVAKRVAPGGRWAEQRSRDRGAGIEFVDYRPYTRGDDLRAIDWNIYRRLHKVFIRLFEEMEDLPVYLLPDLSRSMWLESPPRARAGLRAAVALAAIGLNQHDAVGIFPFGEELEVLMRPQSGRSRVITIARRLEEYAAGGTHRAGTNLVGSLQRFRSFGLREGLLVVISDFFDPAGADAIVKELHRARHRLLIVQLARDTDREPDLTGDLRLRDCETGVTEDVSVTSEVIERYRAAYDRFEETLTSFARSRGAGFVRLDCDEPVVPQLATIFESGRLAV